MELVKRAIELAKCPDSEVHKDREIFTNYFQILEQYCYDNEIIIGGNIATLMLLGEELTHEDYYYILYTPRALQHGRNIADLFYQEGDKYTHMITRVPRQEFELVVDERPIAKLKNLATHRGAHISDIIMPSFRPGYFIDLELMCMGPEIQLIEIYTNLTNPDMIDDWPRLLEVERKLRELFIHEIDEKLSAVVGGSDDEVPQPPDMTLKELNKILLEKFVPDKRHVMLYPRDICRIQLISSRDLDEEAEKVKSIAAEFGLNIQLHISDPKLPIDHKLRRMTLNIIRANGKKEPFMDIYNAADYQLIPHTKEIAAPFISMKFILVEIWIMQLLLRMNMTGAEYVNKITQKLMKKFGDIVDFFERTDKMDIIFPRTFIGIYQDPLVSEKRRRIKIIEEYMEGKKTFYPPPYFPIKKDEEAMDRGT